MKSPFTGGTVSLHTENMEITFRKENFTVVSQYYKCNDTGEEFTTKEQDGLAINQVYNQYREKYGIPFVEDINEILNKYGISAAKMSKILGFGDNQYLKYTKGEIPSVSNGRMIALIQDVSEFKKLLINAQNEFTPDELLKINKKIAPLQDDNTTFIEQLIVSMAFTFNNKSIYTGYVQPQIKKVKNIILFFANNCDGVFETKLNKLLFYSDFLSFKERGIGLSGLSYKAIAFGPVPQRYSTVYDNVGGTDAEIITFPNGNAGKKIIGKEQFDPRLFSEDEISVLNRVYERFKECKAGEIST
ncbi:MAG: DUF4065 domain-containing protein, partial [Muribaculaceae bacterium]